MAEPLNVRLSNSSDDSPFQEDDSEQESIPREEVAENLDEVIEPLDPHNSQLSLLSGVGHSLDDRRHSRHKHDRVSLTQRDFLKYALDENNETKKYRKMFRAALERLDSETRRAQEAERRALELAQRFKIVNEARVSTQQENERIHTELRMYKVQLDNAQREILRGSDLLKDIEAQRDSAEAAAARARSTARQLKEEQMKTKAREEGRKEGYQEGLRRGYQHARGVGPSLSQFDIPPAGVPPVDDILENAPGPVPNANRMDSLDGFSAINLGTPAPMHHVPPSVSTMIQDDRGIVDDLDPYGAGVQGSRFKETMTTPSTFKSTLPARSQRGVPSGWPVSEPDEEIRYIRAPPSPQRSDYTNLQEGFIPTLGPDHTLAMPPPHGLQRPPSISTAPPSIVSPSEEPNSASTLGVRPHDYAYGQRPRASPRSVAESLPSTTISHFDLVNAPPTAMKGLRDRSSGLSAIPEVSSTLEYSPSMDGRVRSNIFPGDMDGIPSRPHSRSREQSQRMADDLSYSDPEQMEMWRRSTASQSHPSSSREKLTSPHRPAQVTTPSPLGAPPILSSGSPGPLHHRTQSLHTPSPNRPPNSRINSGSHRRTASSTPVSIRIEPPSGPNSSISPGSLHDNMLSPVSSRRHMQPDRGNGTPTPERPHSRPYSPSPSREGAHSPYQRAPSPQNPTYIVPPSPRRTPVPMQSQPAYPYAHPGSSSSSSLGRPKSRGGSVDFGRPPSSLGRPPSARPITPSHSSGPYPDPTPGVPPVSSVPSVLRSPSRTSSRQSIHPDPARPASRASEQPQRSFSMHAGSTPGAFFSSRPLSGEASGLRRVPSASSINSAMSRNSGMYGHYDKGRDLDAAYLSTEDLHAQSPHTMANTVANTRGSANYSGMRPSSPSLMSYASYRS
ncbi:uncharacterized protein BXZ73DRAFT_40424 [Epithele typhae]|uniref:uncharacterized protein n=1 Tax=Epithele typhae TaxID=378194 RepID=UPI0020089978|nr:uncharacterized protein BXZ73DRAFT_40424 [Epithele typhae]KAH9943151.1 hypothetical protein BXZ73DRAFT_40424 [Epithele typhae]